MLVQAQRISLFGSSGDDQRRCINRDDYVRVSYSGVSR